MPVLNTLLNLVPFGVVIVRPSGKVVLSNPAAERIFADGGLIAVRDGRLKASSASHDRALTEAIGQAGRDMLSRPAPFSMVRSGCPPVSLAVVPVRHKNALREVLVVLSDPMHHVAVDPDILSAMFDFSPAEALIAQHMAEGKDTRDVAAHLKLSTHTVRNHLKRLFSKTNTKKQCELVRVLLRSPAGLHMRDTAPDASSTLTE